MARAQQPRSIRLSLIGLKLFLLVVAAFTLAACSGGNSIDYTMATDAQAEMEAHKSAAREAGAPTRSAKLYADAMRYEERGDQEFAEGDYTAARTNYIEAGGFYLQAKAASSDAVPGDVESEDPAQVAAATARAGIGPLRAEAQRSGAATLAAESLTLASQAAERGERAFTAADYAGAQRAFDRAADLYRTARNRANQARLQDVDDPTEIRNAVVQLKEEVQAAKTTAGRSQSVIWAADTWQRAQTQEAEGDRIFRRGTKEAYLQAQAAFAQALDTYRQAKRKADEAIAADQAEKQKADRAEANAQAAGAANTARSTMLSAKKSVPGISALKDANASYQSAAGKERTAESAFKTGEYLAAASLFKEAGQLYGRAATQIAAAQRTAAPAVPKVADPTPPPADDTAARAEAAQKQKAEADIDRLIRQFERNLESNNLSAVVAMKESQQNWEEFFKSVKSLVANTVVDRRTITLANNTAQVAFRVAMSYTLKGEKQPVDSEISRLWDLELVNGNWVIVASRKN